MVGNVIATFTPPEPDTALGLGIRAVVWHPTGAFLAVGGWDDKVGHYVENEIRGPQR